MHEHGPWNKDEQRYEDGCKSDSQPHQILARMKDFDSTLARARMEARRKQLARMVHVTLPEQIPLPLHRTEAGYPRCATCDGGGCLDCTDPA
jgi:hypothetical protein